MSSSLSKILRKTVRSVNHEREKMIMQEFQEVVERQRIELIQLRQRKEREDRIIKMYSRTVKEKNIIMKKDGERFKNFSLL